MADNYLRVTMRSDVNGWDIDECEANTHWVNQLRSECRIPLRSRAEVDAEIAAEIRRMPLYPSAKGDELVFKGITVERLLRLRAEPTAEPPSGPSSADVDDNWCQQCRHCREQDRDE